VLGANRTSPAAALPEERCYAGDTQVVDFHGTVLARAADHQEDTLTATLDLEARRRFLK
jgi:predicted amidohydrolase